MDKKILLSSFVILILFFSPLIALATHVQGQPHQRFEPGELPSAAETGLRGGNLLDFVADMIRVVLGILGILLLVLIIYGGFLYATAGGDETKVAGARNTIVYAIIGIVIIAAAWVLSDFVIGNVLAG